ncbi:MAG TPA: adenylyltransferase/cytidyltransferase family protein [Pyrinomonadaceae bacterium]|nr:adenylyltransferase/cytidyltransferase family protein [Pyrinomonadaceae bacterium]
MMADVSTEAEVVRTLSGNQSLDWLLRELEQQRLSGKRIVTTNGCFDLLHPGHVAFLNAARGCGDLLVVLLNSDSSVRQLKGPSRPLITQDGRAEILLALRAVDYVLFFEEQLPNEMLRLIRPDVHCKASDYEANELPEAEVVKSGGGEIRILPFLNGYSTTTLANRLAEPPDTEAG